MAKDNSDFRKGEARRGIRGDEGRPRRRSRDEDDDEEDEDRPRRRSRADEEDEEDERPRRRPSRDDDDEPRRKRRPRDEDDDEESDEDDEDGGPKKTATQAKWEKVKLGLAFSIANAAMVLGAIASITLSFVLFILAGVLSWEALLQFSNILLLLGFLLYIGMEIPAVVAFSLCLNTPNKKGALPLAIISLVIGVINLIVRIIFLVLPLLDQGVSGITLAGLNIAALIFFVFGDAEWILFAFYMKAAMRTLRDQYLAEGTNIPIALACGVIGFKIALIFIVKVKSVRGEGGIPMIATIFGVVVLLIMLFFALTYLKTIIAVRRRVNMVLPKSEDMP